MLFWFPVNTQWYNFIFHHISWTEGLLNKIHHSRLHGLHGEFDGAVGCDDDHPGFGAVILDSTQNIHTIHLRHFQVQKHQPEWTLSKLLQRLSAIHGRLDRNFQGLQ